MYSHNGSWDFLKLFSVLVFICVAVWWLNGAIGSTYTVLIIFALVGVLLFAGGALLAAAIQKTTMHGITKFNADDSQIDRYRMQSFKAIATGQAAMDRAAAQLTVLDAKRVNSIATQQAKLLTDTERQKWAASLQPAADAWTWDDDEAADSGSDAGASFQSWR